MRTVHESMMMSILEEMKRVWILDMTGGDAEPEDGLDGNPKTC